ncbi:type VI secretion system ATPase TssH [Pseudoduganella danionis]|uniref:Type VI secretion system ATPase TssH n=1 Tax=Pseudoduganella danionis TaxID=1890295 RepID=A0ABW9SNB3_9BURK|nr:type VI secretion system ATPase TssH [Pseudoduganella danionis]MTW33532.1 type VI secretion system ATPase TssH [Pseudoduganella danionis]
MEFNLKTLVSKLNPATRQAFNRAAGICVGMGQFEVEVEHLMLALLEQPRSDVCLILQRADISSEALMANLQATISQLKAGSTRTPVFSADLLRLLEHAWMIASLAITQTGSIRSGHMLVALLTDSQLAQLAQRASPLFARLPIHEIKHQLERYTQGSEEAQVADSVPPQPDRDAASVAASAVPCQPTPALAQYTVCLTGQAGAGQLDPVIGREKEIRQLIDILMRRRQNNPILTGDAGVGKTAVVEGLALRIVAGAVPEVLRKVAIHTLDLGLLQAGASVKGEFESRLQNVIDEVKASPHGIILFIDEAHTMIGAGGAAGQNDAANLLKPALARGELRTIAATTWGEYKKYFEKDAALARRFQVVKVEEPDETVATAMLRAMSPLMEQHFGVRVRDEAVTEAVRLSHRYIIGRQLPDKAVSVLDTACARVALAQSVAPARLEDVWAEIERCVAELAAARADVEVAASCCSSRIARLEQQLAALQTEADALALRWQQEQALVAALLRVRAGDAGPENGRGASSTDEAARLRAELQQLQGDAPLVPLEVDGAAVAAIISGWTGIPLGRMVQDELRTVLHLQQALEQRVLGQSGAMAAVAQRVRTARARLDDPVKPQGVFLFAGPSGVGKTETALALADLLYGGERKLITINMSEYQESHSVAGLKGAPPGYVGYGQGGVLTEAVRRNPYSVVLLDEIEKAHADVIELFYQVFDKGVMEDAEGREIDFRNCIIIATSNLGSAAVMQACLNQTAPAMAQLEQLLLPHLVRHFKPAFIGRLKVVPFYPIADHVLAQIIALKLGQIARRLQEQHGAEFSYEPAVIEAVLQRCTEVDAGARNVDHILNGTLLPEIAGAILQRISEAVAIERIKVGINRQGQFKYTFK